MADKYKVTGEKTDQFISILLMDYLVNQKGDLPILMDGHFKVLEPLVIKLVAAGYLRTPARDENSPSYIATDKGRDALAKFMQRYSEYLKVFDVFCAVDLTEGTFAFAKFYDFDTDNEWDAYLNQENWEDVRIAVAEYKKLDPLEIVFMSFLNENRFDLTTSTWQFDITSGEVWEEIEKICNAALTIDQINQGNDTVMPDIIKQGAELTVSLLQREEEMKKQDQPEPGGSSDNTTETTTTITEENYEYPSGYYQSYSQPGYISPLWLGLLFLL